jgi:hypothetical protein
MESINKITIYNSVRNEILEQKKCQFQMLGLALTFSGAIIAWKLPGDISYIFIVPMLMNVLALTIILDKAASIQRMVGYLQLMENDTTRDVWKWEYHLNAFRGFDVQKIESPNEDIEKRKHKYIRNIAIMLLALNVISIFLYGWRSSKLVNSTAVDITMHIIVLVMNLIGIIIFFTKWFGLVHGGHTTTAIKERWLKALASDTAPAVSRVP